MLHKSSDKSNRFCSWLMGSPLLPDIEKLWIGLDFASTVIAVNPPKMPSTKVGGIFNISIICEVNCKTPCIMVAFYIEVSHLDKSRVLSELWDKNGGRCARCGAPLEKDNVVIEHIFPRIYGGSDRMENLRLLCSRCNTTLAGHFPLSENVFQQYLQQFLLHDSRFKHVRTDVQTEIVNGQKTVFDIMFSRTINGREEQFIVEIKINRKPPLSALSP